MIIDESSEDCLVLADISDLIRVEVRHRSFGGFNVFRYLIERDPSFLRKNPEEHHEEDDDVRVQWFVRHQLRGVHLTEGGGNKRGRPSSRSLT